MKELMRHLPGIFFVSFLLFVLINVGAFVYLDNFPLYEEEKDLFVQRFSDAGLDIRRQVFEIDDRSTLDSYANPPGIRPHPVLHFTEGLSKPYYTVGVEGIRYLPGWTDKDVEEKLKSDDSLTFVFGGSTTFGDGVPDEDTVVAYLDELDTSTNHLNFAVEAYDSIREVDKLLHLLRKGYRPKTVIFIDGLNDVTTMASSPYDTGDSPRTQGLVLDRGEIPAIFGMPVKENMLLAMAYSFPVAHLIHNIVNDKHDSDISFSRRSGQAPGLKDWQELMYLFYDGLNVQVNRVEEFAEEVTTHYRDNMAFVRQLGEAFGFEARFIYQPIGLLDSNNPFLTNKFHSSNYFKVYEAVDAVTRRKIINGDLDMLDCSQSVADGQPGTGYVDPTHFSPAGNKALALCIQRLISDARAAGLNSM